MNNFTEIITLPQETAQHLVICLRSPSKKESEEILDRLADIIEFVGNQFYEKWNDPLSFSLLEWGTNVLAEVQSKDLTDELIEKDSFKETIRDQLDILISKIMVDFIEKTALRNPVLIVETGWTCEKFFVNLSNMALNGKPVTTVTHDFAIEMIKWISSLYSNHSLETSNALVNNNHQSAINPFTTIQKVSYTNAEIESIKRSFGSTYRMKAQNVALIQKIQGLTQAAFEESEELKWLKAVIEERLAKRMELEKQEASKSLQKLNSRIDELEGTHKEQIEILTSRAAVTEQKLDQSEKEIVQLTVESARQKNEISSLRGEIYRRQQELEAVRRRNANKRRSGCTIF